MDCGLLKIHSQFIIQLCQQKELISQAKLKELESLVLEQEMSPMREDLFLREEC